MECTFLCGAAHFVINDIFGFGCLIVFRDLAPRSLLWCTLFFLYSLRLLIKPRMVLIKTLFAQECARFQASCPMTLDDAYTLRTCGSVSVVYGKP